MRTRAKLIAAACVVAGGVVAVPTVADALSGAPAALPLTAADPTLCQSSYPGVTVTQTAVSVVGKNTTSSTVKQNNNAVATATVTWGTNSTPKPEGQVKFEVFKGTTPIASFGSTKSLPAGSNTVSHEFGPFNGQGPGTGSYSVKATYLPTANSCWAGSNQTATFTVTN